jgi:hypothetical protein
VIAWMGERGCLFQCPFCRDTDHVSNLYAQLSCKEMFDYLMRKNKNITSSDDHEHFKSQVNNINSILNRQYRDDNISFDIIIHTVNTPHNTPVVSNSLSNNFIIQYQNKTKKLLVIGAIAVTLFVFYLINYDNEQASLRN